MCLNRIDYQTGESSASQWGLRRERRREGLHCTPLVLLGICVMCLSLPINIFFKCSIKNTASSCHGGRDAEEGEPGLRGVPGSDPGTNRTGLPSRHSLFQKVPPRNVLHKALEGSGKRGLSLRPLQAIQTGLPERLLGHLCPSVKIFQ